MVQGQKKNKSGEMRCSLVLRNKPDTDLGYKYGPGGFLHKQMCAAAGFGPRALSVRAGEIHAVCLKCHRLDVIENPPAFQ